MNLVGDSSNRRLFHGHDCGADLGYTLVSQIYLPLGTWGTDAVSAYSQPPDGECEPEGDGFEQCNFILPPGGEKLGIEFDQSFDLSQINYTTKWLYGQIEEL